MTHNANDKTYKLLKNIPESQQSIEKASNKVVEAYRIGRFLQQANEVFAELKKNKNVEEPKEKNKQELKEEIKKEPKQEVSQSKLKLQQKPQLKVQKLKLKTKPIKSLNFKNANSKNANSKNTNSKNTNSMKEQLSIPPIELTWSTWHNWNDLKQHLRKSKIKLPTSPGVYQVKLKKQKELLAVGKTMNLRSRVKQGLVVGSVSFSLGKKIRKNEKCSELVVRWAETNRISTVEETLHLKYKEDFGKFPKYTKQI
ncbi:hypothetical protein [Candidatus Uabimicrobium sp. HlEnr_7]|uniref:hypothetical protein n=1 Tax=Candidatus Uabimicrobium helgolandensis TaxID=3095367 RepID=UPI003558036D